MGDNIENDVIDDLEDVMYMIGTILLLFLGVFGMIKVDGALSFTYLVAGIMWGLLSIAKTPNEEDRKV